MDAYPPELVAHETPLLLVSGLGSEALHAGLHADPAYIYPQLAENGTRVSSTVPAVSTPAGDLLLEHLLKADRSGIWAGRAAEKPKPQTPAWRIRAVGRNYILPPRKASPPAGESPDAAAAAEAPPPRLQVLHSPISPLSPDSPLYPDGVMSPLWLRKHQQLLPAVFVAVHELYTATNDLPLQNLRDNELIAAVNAQKKPFAPNAGGTYTAALGADDVRSSAHRSRFAVILLCSQSILSSSPRIDERLSYIRRSTSLTPNSTFFFFLPALSAPVEVAAFVAAVLAALYPAALEYYRDLSKHSRRKRNKASVPPPTVPSSRALSLHAWNLRYDFKLAALAEFRREPDAAARNYEAAYEKLLAEVFETTTAWSARWTEARLLADATALRIVRCHLWSEHYTAAQRRWRSHVALMADVLDRKGRGTHTYGFAAWVARWNRCLAELLVAADVPVFAVGGDVPALFAVPEKGAGAPDGVGPLDCLQHPGFYYLRAAEQMGECVKRAMRGAGEDSAVDTYLCAASAEEVVESQGAEQLALLVAARREFEVRGQKRMGDGIGVSIAKLKMAAGMWGEGLKELRGVAGGYRKEGWWDVLEEVLWGVVECARNSGDGGSVVVAGLELLCKDVFRERKGWAYDLGRCLDGVDTVKMRPTMVVRGGDVVSFLTATYTFASPRVHVGDSIASQLAITSSAQPSSAPVTFSELKISYEGPLKTILLKHTPSSSSAPSAPVSRIDLKDAIHELHHSTDDPLPSPTSSKSFLYADVDLALAPGETKVFELSSTLREAGEAKAICATFVFVCDGFELDFMIMLDPDDEESSVHVLPGRGQSELAPGSGGVWWAEAPKKGEDGVELRNKPVRGIEPGRLEILPRPPKMDVSARSAVEGDVYVDEVVRIAFEAVNGEDEDAVVDVGVKILGWPGDEPPAITWLSTDGAEELPTASLFPLGTLPPGASAKRTFTFPSPSFPADCAIEITAHYRLVSDPETPIAKPIVAEMPVISPFRTNFDFSPRVHPDRWPDYFSLSELDITPGPDGKERALGITQRWCLTVGIAGMSRGAVELESSSLPILATAGGILATVVSATDEPTTLQHGATTELQFILDIQKLSLEDRRSSSVDVALHLQWRRADPSPDWPALANTTVLPVPRLPVPGSEPRVLAAVVAPLEAAAAAEAPESPLLKRVRTASTGASTLSPTLPTGAGAIPGVVHVEYTLENPTNYFLTFNVVMEANEEFAFSGPKQTSLQLLPVSRVALRYCLFTFKIDAAQKGAERRVGFADGDKDRDGAWVRPGLRVVDRYFNKTLRVSPGSEGVAVDKAGLMVWVPSWEEEGGGAMEG